ncbi:YchJ family protein [Gallibacterium trehalosifermentans]|uniref:YchJ family protein n=1 Tax=Gallibacterium trehalosifermentans TaxID=516935 RepID=A0ABV6H1F0_9PAST
MQCPCQSGLAYTDCCQSLHQHHQFAQTAEQLMRSRYAAFVLAEIDYIVETTVPAQQTLLNKKALRQWSLNTQWCGLEIIKFIPEADKNHALVEFKAYYQENENIQAHHELSTFVKIAEKWYFLDPTVPCKLTMKQPCLCHSGKKFKQCCAPFLSLH